LKRRFEREGPQIDGARTVGVTTRPRRRLDAVRRPQILRSAVEMVREKGLWEVRISDVAKRAGVSPASVVYYFGSKDQLLAQAIAGADDAFYEALVPELERLDTGAARLACLIVRSSTSEWVLWIDLWLYARRHPEIAGAQRRFHHRWRSAIADVVRYGAQRGEWPTGDAVAAAVRLGAVTDGLAVHMVLGDPDHSRENYVAHSLTAAARELGCDRGALEAAAEACRLGEVQAV
jgi:AcrR family transcriptional regulator